MMPKSVEKRLAGILLIVGSVTTLTITPWWNLDPINLGKSLVLTSLAFAAFGLVIPNLRSSSNLSNRSLNLAIALFVLSLISSLIFAHGPTVQQIWGQFGRATGAVSYISLAVILFLFARIQSRRTYERVIISLVVTQLIMCIYCFLQYLDLDPVNWSSFSIFGTLGNVNFLSGFMGVSAVATLALAIRGEYSLYLKIGLFLLSGLSIFLVAKTDSIQGLVAFGIGVITLGFFLISRFGKILVAVYSIMFLLLLSSLGMALLDQGPLRSFIFQPTVVYRADYMNAGIKMLIHNPFTGVGIDSYDDWYRAERGYISAFRTGISRTANTAHNIMIDLGAGGGFPLLAAYVFILVLITASIYASIKKGLSQDPFFLAAACAWVAYQVQASVSINQIGVGVWGWILGGILIGYGSLAKSFNNDNFKEAKSPAANNRNQREIKRGRELKSKIPNTPPPLNVISSVLGLSIGFAVAFVPFKVDADYLEATKKGSLEELLKVTSNPASNTFILSKAFELTKAKYPDQAKGMNDTLVKRYPRNIYGWSARAGLANISDVEREYALAQVKKLDPNLALCSEPDPAQAILSKALALTPSKQYELARWWGLIPSSTEVIARPETFSLSRSDQVQLRQKLLQFCMA